MALKSDPRPVRTLIAFFLALGLLGGLAALGGTFRPALGLDLEGGTRITLSALTGEGSDVNPTSLQQAADIIDSRVNGSGVAEASVTTQGDRNVIVEIPGDPRSDLVEAVTRTAQLRFRIVAAAAPGRASDQTPPPGQEAPAPEEGDTADPGEDQAPDEPAEEQPAPEDQASPEGAPAPGEEATPRPRPAPAQEEAPQDGQGGQPDEEPLEELPLEELPSGELPDQGDQGSVEGAPVDDPLAWSQNPGQEWLVQFSEFTCPEEGEAVVPEADAPAQPLVACDEDGNKYLLSQSVIEGTELRTASSGIPQNGTGYAVQLSFRSGASSTFGDVTTALFNNGGQFAIVLDGTVLSAPGVNSPILDGNAQITGDFTEVEASALANSLRFGALPIRFAEPSIENIGASLAGNQLTAGVLAGVAGLLIVMVYCLGYYRGLGVVVIASLVIAALMTYATVLVLAAAANFALTLPGIAGLIIGVGITADSFIVYFERIRDEMRDGKSMRVAVETGWARARLTCLAADAVSLMAAVVLYIFAIGVVRGFAFALGITTVIDVVVFFFFTKPLMTLLARLVFFNSGHKWSGLSEATLGTDGPRRRPVRDDASEGTDQPAGVASGASGGGA